MPRAPIPRCGALRESVPKFVALAAWDHARVAVGSVVHRLMTAPHFSASDSVDAGLTRSPCCG